MFRNINILTFCEEYTVAKAQRMNAMLRRHARLPIATGRRHCAALQCVDALTSELDAYGDHSAACPRIGALRRRGSAVQRAFRPLWREARMVTSEHPLVRELVPSVRATDGR